MNKERFSDYRIDFREHSMKEEWSYGLSYTLRQTLSVIPAALGHLLDTLLRLDNVFYKNVQSHLNGPFGFLFGVIPFVVGAIVGAVLQFLLNLPMYVGFLLDKGLKRLLGGGLADRLIPFPVSSPNPLS